MYTMRTAQECWIKSLSKRKSPIVFLKFATFSLLTIQVLGFPLIDALGTHSRRFAHSGKMIEVKSWTPWKCSNSITTCYSAKTDDDKINKNEPKIEQKEDAKVPTQEFTGTINPLRLAVLKLGMTELRFTSMLNYEKRKGEYKCAGCGSLLFTSDTKYDSKSGWPSFFASAKDDAIMYVREWDNRLECRCKSCGGHLGHVFGDGPTKIQISSNIVSDIPVTDPTYGPNRLPRFCMNGASLRFYPDE